MTTFTRKLTVRMVDPPDVETWRTITRVFYAIIASSALTLGVYLAARDIGPDLFPPKPAELKIPMEPGR